MNVNYYVATDQGDVPVSPDPSAYIIHIHAVSEDEHFLDFLRYEGSRQRRTDTAWTQLRGWDTLVGQPSLFRG